jgi:TM2 domain-containing membrane protein YozV
MTINTSKILTIFFMPSLRVANTPFQDKYLHRSDSILLSMRGDRKQMAHGGAAAGLPAARFRTLARPAACYNPPSPSHTEAPFPMEAPSPRVRSSGVAFVLALILPGAGQVYAGKALRGAVSFVVFLFAGVGAVAFQVESQLWGLSLRSLLAIYVFSFLDAYQSVQELNARRDPPPYQNPRVAAVLNLLASGWGYFYLGERAKGLMVFMVVRLGGWALGHYQFLWELISFGMAVDAYRLARRALRRDQPAPLWAGSGMMPLGLSQVPPPPALPALESAAVPAPSSRVPRAVPLALAALIGSAYAALVVLGTIIPDYRVLDQSQARFEQTAEERIYLNPRYGVEFHVPASWNFQPPERGSLIQASSSDGICHASLAVDAISPLYSLESGRDAMVEKVLSENPNFQLGGQRATRLGPHPAYELTFALPLDEDDYLTRYVLARRGMTLYSLVLSNRARFDEDCRRLTGVIQLRLVLPL